MEKGLLEVEDAMLIAADGDGRIYPLLGYWAVGMAGMGGALAESLIGLVLLGPLLGMAAGAAVAGGAMWKRTFGGDDYVSWGFVNDLWENLTPGSAAMIVLLREGQPEKVLTHVQLHERGTVIHSSLGPELEAQLDAVEGGEPHPVKKRVRCLALETPAGPPRLTAIAIRLVRT